jgi:hypothetical protein
MSKLLAALLLAALAASAQDARRIIEEVQRRSRTSSERYQGTLRVINARGRVTEKRWRYDRLGSHGSSKAVLRFTAPAEVRGVALLILNHPERSSDQWMWTPALQRERRIALQDRRTRFFGTDFSFEDLEERDVDQYDYRMEGEEVLEGVACWRIEARPRESKISQYERTLLWVRKDHYVYWRIENYTRGSPARRVTYADLEDVQGIWTARTVEMADLRQGSRTILRLEKLAYNLPMKDDAFTLQALRTE